MPSPFRYREDIQLTKRLADAAGHAIRPFYRSEHGLERKGDASPVTMADRAAEQAMRDLLEAERPQDGILGEELGEKKGSNSRQWVLDPIDGTTSFVAGRPIFGTLVALLDQGWPIIGVIDQPILAERWVGVSGGETSFNDVPVRARICPELSDAILATTAPHLFKDGDAEHFMALARQCYTRGLIWGGDCYNYGLLASGQIDLVVESGLKLHDYAALVPIVEAAGGLMCDWNGDPLQANSDGRVIAMGDAARIEDVLEAMANTAQHDHHNH